MGIFNEITKYKKQFKDIQRNRDTSGRILTYTVKHKGFETEHNTLKEARIMAFTWDKKADNKRHKERVAFDKKFLKELKAKRLFGGKKWE